MISIGERLTVLPIVDSTNNYAMAQVRAGLAKQGDAFFALEQTAGKGQRGKGWQTEPGSNIILSVVAEPSMLPMTAQIPGQFVLSAAVAMGCFDFFSLLAGADTRIKWPNDIYWRDRKAGGILIENLIAGNSWLYAVIGIGININQVVFSPELPNPVSLRQITGKEHNAVDLAQQLCVCLQQRISRCGQPGQVLQEYNNVLYKRHETVRLKKDNRVFDAFIKEVNARGQLVVDAGVEEIFDVGEVAFITTGVEL